MKASMSCAVASLAAACVFAVGIACAQSPAVNPTEAKEAAQQAARQQAQPLNNEPVWSEVRSGAPQVTTVTGRETNVLVQPQGQTWRAAHATLVSWGGVLFALAVVGLAVFYMIRGPLTAEKRRGDRVIERFSPADRYAHWLLAIVWVALAITGLCFRRRKTAG